MDPHIIAYLFLGVFTGLAASFTGLGGGFVMVPIMLFLGYPAHKAVGTSFLAILMISMSALVAHNKLANVDYKISRKGAGLEDTEYSVTALVSTAKNEITSEELELAKSVDLDGMFKEKTREEILDALVGKKDAPSDDEKVKAL